MSDLAENEVEQVDPQLMADFEEFMTQRSGGSQATKLAEQEVGGKRKGKGQNTSAEKRRINCEKARAKRTEYAAMRKELEFLREMAKQRALSESVLGISFVPQERREATSQQISGDPRNQPHSQP